MRRYASGIALALLVWCGLAIAEEAKTPATAETTKARAEAGGLPAAVPALPQAIQEVQPPLYYLKDKQGNLQPVPGFSFEQFVDLYKLKSQLDSSQQRPRYSVQQVSITGTAAADRAELTVRLKLTVEGDQWVRAPLQLDQMSLVEPAKYEGPGEHFLQFEENGDGYVAWLRGGSGDQPHQLTLKATVPLARLGEATRLRLLVPRATASELKLKVPVARAVGRVSEGASLVSAESGEKGTTEFSVLGLGGEFQLTWQAADATPPQRSADLEVVGAILARVDGRNVETDAALTVRSYGGPFDRFRVRLPRGAELAAGSAAGFTVETVGATSPADAANRVVEVQLPKKTTGPVDVTLSVKRPCELSKANDWLELGGFEVLEAARQWGHIAVAVVGDWHILWGPSRGARQVDQWPESLRHEDAVAGFEYFSQPFSLSARVVARKTHVSVDPDYLLLVEGERVRLEARLKCSVRGAKLFALDVKMADWQFDQVEPEQLVTTDGVSLGPTRLLSIPFAQPLSGSVELVLRAQRAIPPGSKKLVVPLPQPQATVVGPVSVTVLPDDNVELIPDAQSMSGLIRQDAAPPARLPARQQAPLFYRGEVAKAVFAAAFSVHPQAIGVAATSQVAIDPKGSQVEQKLAYTIAYEPLDRLVLEVPRALAESRGLEATVDGQSVAPVAVGGEADRSADTVRTMLVLPKARIGRCDVRISYPLPIENLVPGATKIVPVPLIMPADGKLTSNRLVVSAAPGVQVRQHQGDWTLSSEEPPRADRRRALEMSSSGPQALATLAVAVEEKETRGGVLVERAWIQTWMTPSARQDRAVFRFTSQEDQVQLTLPEGIVLPPMLLLLDGKPAAPELDEHGRGSLRLREAGHDAVHTLELRYHFSDGRPARGRLELQLPQLGGDPWTGRLYWQLIVPQNEHLLIGPSDLTGQWTWNWEGLMFRRHPLLTQSTLENWAGATPQTAVSDVNNQYLFSGMGRIVPTEVITASRSWIVLVASGAALVLGLVLLYVPASRHPAVLLAAAAGVACVGAIYPDPTILLSQSAVLGLALTLVAGLLERAFSRPHAGRPDFSQPAIEIGSTQVSKLPPVPGSHDSTETAAPRSDNLESEA